MIAVVNRRSIPVTLYLPDVSGYDGGISLRGALAVAIKITEGTGYVNPYWRAQKRSADRAGAFNYGYHFLHHGNGAGQAEFYHRQTTRACMVDFEPTTGSDPDLGDACDFIDRLRQLGGTAYPVYLPRWYHGDLGSPDLGPLRDRHCFLVSSDYSQPYTDADTGAGWQPYGGMTPLQWQYTDSLRFNGYSVDFSAYRGKYAGKQDPADVAKCLADFQSMVETGRTADDAPTAANPVQGFEQDRRGYTSYDLRWDVDHGATSYLLKVYEERTGQLVKQLTTTATSIRVGGLHRSTSYVNQLRARPGGSTGADAKVTVTTRPATH